jgi:RnfABCDGE-type electron transport complex B subunit
MSLILSSVITLGIIAVVASLILYFCAQKFAVEEDPRIGQIAAILPQANCGGCGFPGCPGFAAALVKTATEKGTTDGLSCPVGGAEVMDQITAILAAGGDDAPAETSSSAPAKSEKKPAAPAVLKPMTTDPKPFVTPNIDFSGPKQNPVPEIKHGPKPAIIPTNWAKA